MSTKEFIKAKVNEIGIKHLLERIKKYKIGFFENTNKINFMNSEWIWKSIPSLARKGQLKQRKSTNY